MRALVLFAFVAVAGPAAAQQAPPLRYRVSDTVVRGSPAVLTLVAEKPVRDVRLTLRPAKGKARRFAVASLGPGEEHRVEWKVPVGESRWRAELAWTLAGEAQRTTFDLAIRSLEPLDVEVREADASLVEGRVLARPNRPLKSVELIVRDRRGEIVVQRSLDLAGAGPGPVEIRWEPPSGSRSRIADLKFFDAYGFWAAVRLVEWWIEIAHDDVEFETAKWDVRPEEAPKLDRAIEALRAELTRFRRDLGKAGADVEARLYIAGYTDTVGSAADNLALSEKRARAIAEYFRDHGVELPIFYQGFGEAVLAVPTGDEVDEARNRRAAYLLAAGPPSGPDFPGARWRRLR